MSNSIQNSFYTPISWCQNETRNLTADCPSENSFLELARRILVVVSLIIPLIGLLAEYLQNSPEGAVANDSPAARLSPFPIPNLVMAPQSPVLSSNVEHQADPLFRESFLFVEQLTPIAVRQDRALSGTDSAIEQAASSTPPQENASDTVPPSGIEQSDKAFSSFRPLQASVSFGPAPVFVERSDVSSSSSIALEAAASSSVAPLVREPETILFAEQLTPIAVRQDRALSGADSAIEQAASSMSPQGNASDTMPPSVIEQPDRAFASFRPLQASVSFGPAPVFEAADGSSSSSMALEASTSLSVASLVSEQETIASSMEPQVCDSSSVGSSLNIGVIANSAPIEPYPLRLRTQLLKELDPHLIVDLIHIVEEYLKVGEFGAVKWKQIFNVEVKPAKLPAEFYDWWMAPDSLEPDKFNYDTHFPPILIPKTVKSLLDSEAQEKPLSLGVLTGLAVAEKREENPSSPLMYMPKPIKAEAKLKKQSALTNELDQRASKREDRINKLAELMDEESRDMDQLSESIDAASRRLARNWRNIARNSRNIARNWRELRELNRYGSYRFSQFGKVVAGDSHWVAARREIAGVGQTKAEQIKNFGALPSLFDLSTVIKILQGEVDHFGPNVQGQNPVDSINMNNPFTYTRIREENLAIGGGESYVIGFTAPLVDASIKLSLEIKDNFPLTSYASNLACHNGSIRSEQEEGINNAVIGVALLREFRAISS